MMNPDLELISNMINDNAVSFNKVLLNEYGNVITKRLKVNANESVVAHDPNNGFVQYAVSLPVEAIDLRFTFSPSRVFHQIVDTLFSLYDLEKKTIKLESYYAPERENAKQYVKSSMNGLNYALQLIDVDGAEYIVFDFIIKK